jgi:hypothetical protein
MQKDAEADAHAGNAICNRYDSFEQDYELGDSCADLRVEEPPEEENGEPAVSSASVENPPVSSAAAVSSQGEPGATDPTLDPQATDTAPMLQDDGDQDEIDPYDRRPLKLRDEKLEIPLMLTEEQYHEAQVAIFQYRMDHNIDSRDVAKKVVPQRAAISQKIVLRERKPVASVTVEDEPRQLVIGNETFS